MKISRSARYSATLGAFALVMAAVTPAVAQAATPAPPLPGPAAEAQVPGLNPAVPAMTSPIYRVIASNGNTLLTPWEAEARGAVEKHGWERYELAFYASTTQLDNTIPVYRLYNAKTNSFLHTATEKEAINSAQHGFTNEGARFYVPAWGMRGTDKVYRLHKVMDGVWRFQDVIGEDGVAAAQAEGWILDGHTYSAVRPAAKPETPEAPPVTPPSDRDGDGRFTLVQINDTQHDVDEYFDLDDKRRPRERFEGRVDWILANEEAQDIRFITHTGDIVNWWETATNNRQYTVASEVLGRLVASDIPFAAAVGNHDTLAVGDGDGSANKDENGESIAYWGLRQTDLINEALPASYFRNMAGQMEAGKFDNSYHLFTAEGADFLVLALELYPRQRAIDWAEGVVAKHPKHNVILLQHHWLDRDGSIHTGREYGDRSPAEVQKQIVDRYSNVKMVLSGHTGMAAARTYTAPNGNQVLYSMTNLSYDKYGPLRLFDIDVPGDKVNSQVIGALDGSTGLYAGTYQVDWITK